MDKISMLTIAQFVASVTVVMSIFGTLMIGLFSLQASEENKKDKKWWTLSSYGYERLAKAQAEGRNVEEVIKWLMLPHYGKPIDGTGKIWLNPFHTWSWLSHKNMQLMVEVLMKKETEPMEEGGDYNFEIHKGKDQRWVIVSENLLESIFDKRQREGRYALSKSIGTHMSI